VVAVPTGDCALTGCPEGSVCMQSWFYGNYCA
jgi:hypothetical protein